MNSMITAFIYSTLLYLSVQALNCSQNPCDLGGYFIQKRGYQCVQFNTQALCTCPNGGYEMDQPCRVCNRINPTNNPCNPSPAFLACLETDEYGTKFACLCESPSGPVLTTSTDCELTVTLTSTPVTMTSTIVSVTPSKCFNGGYFVDGNCHCPSGFVGIVCEQKFGSELCDGIICQNKGVCAIRNPNGPTESVCLCRYGTWGDYCQLTGILGYCSPGLCMNNAPCIENVIGLARHAYCDCLPGYNGTKCDNQYFKCTHDGKFTDDYMNNQGAYFECTQVNQLIYRLERKSCPKGLRFNISKNTCTHYSIQN